MYTVDYSLSSEGLKMLMLLMSSLLVQYHSASVSSPFYSEQRGHYLHYLHYLQYLHARGPPSMAAGGCRREAPDKLHISKHHFTSFLAAAPQCSTAPCSAILRHFTIQSVHCLDTLDTRYWRRQCVLILTLFKHCLSTWNWETCLQLCIFANG